MNATPRARMRGTGAAQVEAAGMRLMLGMLIPDVVGATDDGSTVTPSAIHYRNYGVFTFR